MTRPQALLAVSLAFVATAVYAVMWVGHSQDWGWLHSFDWSLLNAAHDIGIKNPAWVRFWDGVSLILGPVVLRPLGLLAAMVALAKRKIRIALLLLACLPLNAIMTIAAKSVAHRPRPATALVSAHSTSFPSGHALEATASVLALLTVLLPMLHSRFTRHIAITVGALCVLTVGVARVALNVHHPTERCCRLGAGVPVFPRVPVRISTAVDIRCPTRVSCFVAASGGVETTRTGSRHGPLKPWCAVHFALSPHSDPAGF